MKTKNPTTVRLSPLVFHDDEPRNGAPRFLVLLPKDGGRAIVTLHGAGFVTVRGVEDRDAEDLREVGQEPCADRFEPFVINGVAYRFDWNRNEADGKALPYLYASRLGTISAGDATPGAARKLQELCAEVAAWVQGFHAEAANEANENAKAREVATIDGKLAKLAEEVASLQRRRLELGGEVMPRVLFEGGLPVLDLGGVETTLAARDGGVRLGVDFEDEEERARFSLRVGDLEGNEAASFLALEVVEGFAKK